MAAMLLLVLVTAGLFWLKPCSEHHAPFSDDLEAVRDVGDLEKRLLQAAAMASEITTEEIGQVEYGKFRAPVWLASIRPHEETERRILINAGIHGNEPAGTLCLIELIEDLAGNKRDCQKCGLDILLLVNPWGYCHDIRYNRDGRDINRDFSELKSQEAKIVKKFLEGRKYNLCLDLHEDPECRGFYLYQYSMPDETIAAQIVAAVRNMGYEIEPNSTKNFMSLDNGTIRVPMAGVLYMKWSGQLSIGNYYRLNNGDNVYTVETPTGLPLEKRIEIHSTVVNLLIDSYSR